MSRQILIRSQYFLALITLLVASVSTAIAQPTVFRYQGRLTDSSLPSTGIYDFEFRLYDALTDGTQVIAPIQRLNVEVTEGVFTVPLDFGASPFTGWDRFLEIAVRPAGGGEFTTLTPREQIMRVPYAIYSDSAYSANTAGSAITAQSAVYAETAEDTYKLGGVHASQYVQTNDPRLAPLPDSPLYIQNSTTQQPSSNFNISGNGTAGGTLTGNIVSATTQYNIGAARVLSSQGAFNFFAGNGAGQLNTSGSGNSFFGFDAGRNNTAGANNAYFGRGAGRVNTAGSSNAFFGANAGDNNATGSGNSLFGAHADVASTNLTNATAIGVRAYVSVSNALVLGQIGGVNGATADTKVGIGTTAPSDRLHVNGIIRVETLGAAGSTSLCRNTNAQISTCSSSLRYKTAITPFRDGLNLVNRLNPISFTWKDGGMRDLGLGAEDVAAVEPLLVTRNDKGEVEGVKYDRVALVLLNAVKEQQDLINKQDEELKRQRSASLEQQRKLEQQQRQLDALRKHVCQNNPQAEACK